MSFNKIVNISFLLFYPVTMLHWLLQFSGYRFAILAVFLRAVLLFGYFYSLECLKKNFTAQTLTIFIVYNLISIVFVFSNSIWLEGYYYDVLNFILPMSAFYVGNCLVVDKNKLYDALMYSAIFCCAFGLGMLFFSSGWYVERLSIVSQELLGTELGDSEEALHLTRFSSFLYSPYGIQYFGIPAMTILLYKLLKTDYGESKIMRLFLFLSLIIFIVSIVLCQMRVSWAYMIILLVSFGWLGMKSPNGRRIFLGVIIVLIIGSIAYTSISNSSVGASLAEPLTSRIAEMSFSTAMSGRTDQYASLLNNWNRPILGYGMGTGGATARIAGLPGASDAGYMKILYENGMVGFILFLLIMVPTVFRILKHPKRYVIEGHIVFFFLIAMLGSNSLSISVYYSVILWFALGVIWRKNNHNLQNRMLSWQE